MAAMKTKPLGFASLLVVAWLLSTGASFWWFQFKDLRAFGNKDPTGSFDSESLLQTAKRLLPEDEPRPVVLHFWDPDCACSRFNNRHVRELIATYEPKGFRFMIVPRTNSAEQEQALREKAKREFGAVEVVFIQDAQLDIPSSPAVLVLNRGLNLTYFGPYSNSAICSARTGRLVEAILDDIVQGREPAPKVSTLAHGCFCDWDRARQIS